MKKWYQDWIEVFKSGKHTDSKGNTRMWNDEDLDRIIQNYDAQEHEAPVVIGHPSVEAPAYGWVEALKRENGRLLVKLKKVVPEFVQWVEKGLYRKISVAIGADGTLRHVGFLGAVPPAIKGLKHAFAEDCEFSSYENELSSPNAALKPTYTSEQTAEFSELLHNYNELLARHKRLEAKTFVEGLCSAGKISAAYSEFLVETLCGLDGGLDGAYSESERNPADVMKEFLASLAPRCTFGEIAKTDEVKSFSPDEELGLKIAGSL